MMTEDQKTHFEKYKMYYFGATLILGGVVIGLASGSRLTINNSAVASPVVNTVVDTGGYTRKLVECVETGQIWRSVTDAASAAGVSPAMMSKHINGHRDHISDLHYRIVGLGAS